jgi:predicted permease
MIKEIRYALRSLGNNVGFTVTAILSIALGIGANAGIFSLADALLLRPLPVQRPSEVVSLSSLTAGQNSVLRMGSGTLSYRDFVDFRDKNQSFENLVAFQLVPAGFAKDAKTQPQLRMGMLVTGNFFRALGVEPTIGRGFRPEEDQVPERDAVMVLSHELWEQEFASNASVIGKMVRLGGVDFTVIGVAPEGFTGMDQYLHPAFFVPVMMGTKLLPSNPDLLTNRNLRGFNIKGRLKPGTTMTAASGEASVLAKSLEQAFPDSNRGVGAIVRTEIQTRLDREPYALIQQILLFGMVVTVLLIACANVANLQLGRGRARAREIAVRLAIGASRSQLLRQLMIENVIIAIASGLLGLLVGEIFVQVFSALDVPGDVPVQLGFRLDARVLIFTFLVSIASTVFFGLIPALSSTRSDLVTMMRSGESDQARKRFFGRTALVVVQVAGSFVLLAAATQLYRGFAFALKSDYGFRVDHRLTMRFDPSIIGYSFKQTADFYKLLVERARELPGVKSAALSFFIPTTIDFRQQTVIPEGYQFPPGQESASVFSDIVDHHYFETLGVPLLRGRGFLGSDVDDSPPVAVVNEAFAEKYLGPNPVGKRIQLTIPKKRWVEVVGVSVTGKHVAITEPPLEFLYLPLTQNPLSRMTLIVESYGDPVSLIGPLRDMVHSIDPNLPIFRVRTMDDLFQQRTVKSLRVANGVFGLAGLIGLGLALVGLYAVVSYQVARRTREIGIRMAIGARGSQILKMILMHAGGMGAVGAAIGLILSIVISRGIAESLGLSPFNPVVFGVIAIGLVTTTLLAAAIPARRASQIDPQKALRED